MIDLCPDGLLPDGEVCPKCGGDRLPSGLEKGLGYISHQTSQKQVCLNKKLRNSRICLHHLPSLAMSLVT
jgi:hypothetical protein